MGEQYLFRARHHQFYILFEPPRIFSRTGSRGSGQCGTRVHHQPWIRVAQFRSRFDTNFREISPITPALHKTISGFAHAISEHPVEILPNVPQTLQYLSGRHRLILMTKGAIAEQSGKVERSGLKEHFSAVEIVAEKNAATYREVVSKYALPADSTWMIGNSPKSDINPALAAGLNAVFVPHGDTWILEHEEVVKVEAPSRLLVVERFANLREHF